jgi:hypothetical protein
MFSKPRRSERARKNGAFYGKLPNCSHLQELAHQPWRCLCRGSVQITYTTRRRRTILQFLQIFLTDGRTFTN